MCAYLSIGPTSDELDHPIGIQVEGVDAHCMILRLREKEKQNI